MTGTTPCQIKVCGLTDPADAAACADSGVQAVGLVFYPESRRCIGPEQAAAIRGVLPDAVQTIGVFVDEPAEEILAISEKGRLTGVQLHGTEPPGLVRTLKAHGLFVIKAFYLKGEPSIHRADAYGADACLVEFGRGRLPGGNAMKWNWSAAAAFGARRPFILAGGLCPETVAAAITGARPDAVDVSSGVEASPGRKDSHKIEAFVRAVTQCPTPHQVRRIF
jgi:phosphoribosylanthranilate isomerase